MKTTFQWRNVVSYAIFPTGGIIVLKSGLIAFFSKKTRRNISTNAFLIEPVNLAYHNLLGIRLTFLVLRAAVEKRNESSQFYMVVLAGWHQREGLK